MRRNRAMLAAVDRRALPSLLWISDGRGDVDRLTAIVAAAVGAGLRAVQLREPVWSARQLAEACGRVQPLLAAVGGLLFVNDRVDVAAMGCCDGVQVGHRSVPVAAARRALGPQPWLGASCHGAEELAAAAAGGADFALLSPIWPTASKPGHPGLGLAAAGALTAAAALPIVWLGGVTASRIATVRALPQAQRPVGFAVLGAIGSAADPAAATAALVQAVDAALAT